MKQEELEKILFTKEDGSKLEESIDRMIGNTSIIKTKLDNISKDLDDIKMRIRFLNKVVTMWAQIDELKIKVKNLEIKVA